MRLRSGILLGIFAYLAQVKSIVKTSFNYLYGVIPCRRYYAFPRWRSAFDLKSDSKGYENNPTNLYINDIYTKLSGLLSKKEDAGWMNDNEGKKKEDEVTRDLFEIIKNTTCSNIKVVNYKKKTETIGNAACLNLETRGSLRDHSPFDIFYSLIPMYAAVDTTKPSSSVDAERVIKAPRRSTFKYLVSPICIA